MNYLHGKTDGTGAQSDGHFRTLEFPGVSQMKTWQGGKMAKMAAPDHLSKKSKAHLASREKMETTANALDPEILAARNELNDEIDCGNRDKA
jgi:hypothetical protein